MNTQKSYRNTLGLIQQNQPPRKQPQKNQVNSFGQFFVTTNPKDLPIGAFGSFLQKTVLGIILLFLFLPLTKPLLHQEPPPTRPEMMKFSRETWYTHPEKRYLMLRNLAFNVIKTGMTAKEIEKLIGKPSPKFIGRGFRPDSAFPNHFHPFFRYEYSLISPEIPYEKYILYLTFEKDGELKKSRLAIVPN